MPVLLDRGYVSEILEFDRRKIAEWCEAVVDAPSTGSATADLAGDIDEYWPAGRRDFCEFLGIGESTLSGWLKENRVPRYAKVAYGLLLACDLLRGEVKRLRQDARGLKILKAGEFFQVCVFRPNEDGIVVGRIIADRVPSFQNAALLANSLSAMHLLNDAKRVINEVLEHTEGYPVAYVDHLEELRNTITERTTFVSDQKTWKELYGENRFAHLMDIDLDERNLEGAAGAMDTGIAQGEIP